MLGCLTRHRIETSRQNMSTSDFAEKGDALYLRIVFIYLIKLN